MSPEVNRKAVETQLKSFLADLAQAPIDELLEYDLASDTEARGRFRAQGKVYQFRLGEDDATIEPEK